MNLEMCGLLIAALIRVSFEVIRFFPHCVYLLQKEEQVMNVLLILSIKL